jgi:membrane fusion protein, heavy metal efflux system
MMNRRSSRRPALLPALLLLGLAACGKDGQTGKAPAEHGEMAGMDSPTSDAAPASIVFNRSQVQHGHVVWGPATPGRAASTVAIPARISANEDRTARLGAPASGRIISVRVAPGDRVARGQTLLIMRSPEAGQAQSEVAKATESVTSARAQAAYTASARARAERLLALTAISRQDYERAIADDEMARAALAQANSEANRARATSRALGAEGAVTGETLLRSPIAGVVLERTAVPGAVVEAGAPLVAVTDPATLWLVINAPEALSGAFRKGALLRFTTVVFPADTFAAQVTAVGAGLDPETRALPVRGLIRNSAGRLKPEMLATALAGGDSTRVILLPETAVQSVDGQPTVFLARPDSGGGVRLTRRAVSVGARSGGFVTITRGVAPGDTVVQQGAFAVKAELEKAAMPKMEM